MGYKEGFVKFLFESGVLKFGEFILKSGRKSPYFLNAGNYNTGRQLAELGEFYADCIKENGIEFDTLFGPAYKGIPLSVAAAVALSGKYGQNVNYCFDRKEAKDHGEGGVFIGKQPEDNERFVIIDDVVTSGKALRETLPKLKEAADVRVEAMVITVDRMERALDSKRSAVEQIYEDFGIKVYPIITVMDIIAAIKDGVIGGRERLDEIEEYLETYM